MDYERMWRRLKWAITNNAAILHDMKIDDEYLSSLASAKIEQLNEIYREMAIIEGEEELYYRNPIRKVEVKE